MFAERQEGKIMNLVSQKEYYKDLKEFSEKHGGARVDTSSMTNNAYSKHYYSEDGAFFYEYNSIVIDDIEFTYHGQHFKTTAKFYVTEYYSTDNPNSKYVFQCV